MFAWSGFETLDLSNFNTSKVTSMGQMFRQDTKLKTIYVSDLWDTSKVTNSSSMFQLCTSLTGVVPFDYNKIDVTMANYTNGYLTYKKNTN